MGDTFRFSQFFGWLKNEVQTRGILKRKTGRFGVLLETHLYNFGEESLYLHKCSFWRVFKGHLSKIWANYNDPFPPSSHPEWW